MDESEKNYSSLISEFQNVTGASSEKAKRYLQETNWNVEAAVNLFEEDAENEDQEAPNPQVQVPPQASASSRIVTMNSLRQNYDDSDEEEGQAFYAGGSTRSGQQVLGPGKKNTTHLVKEIFRAARSHGAEVVDPAENQSSSTRLRVFGGAGYVLGASSMEPSVMVNPKVVREPEKKEVILRAWRTGFTVDGGPLREYTDPQNEEFLNSIRRGQIPEELIHSSGAVDIGLDIEDHSHEDYSPPKPKIQAFSGKGHRLGSPSPKINTVTDEKTSVAEAEKMLDVDSTKPITSIQIRLSHGGRIVVKVNHHHTIGDIRRYIVVACPEYSASEFKLMTSFPTSELSDDDISIKDANLLNSTLIQKLI